MCSLGDDGIGQTESESGQDMNSILKSCKPRPDLTSGSFNPEVFTASLRQVIGHYRGDVSVTTAYTDAEVFFEEATSPTYGMRRVVEHVLRRLSGDNMVPFLSRLETGFGGGKTHTLIACLHLAYRGTELAQIASKSNLVDPENLPEPGSVDVVGIAGDEISVVLSQGEQVVPYTLWAELAKQVGGEDLLAQVEAEAFTPAAPGEAFFDRVLGNRKVLIMVDELAQYAARAEAARPGMGEQIAAFFMALFNYARNHTGIAIVVTLASSTDAFAGQTKTLAKLLEAVAGNDVSQDEAREIGEQALDSIQSVIARDAKVETPVSSEELSSVLAKRLFVTIDRAAAKATASEYKAFYTKHRDHLPPRCTRESGEDNESSYANLVEKYYPFHPSLVDFLNKKLATAEDFQGTRGVLRVLAFAVKSIWGLGIDLGTIHTCHLDTTNPDLVNEMLSKTESGDLMNVLTADVGAVRGHGDTLITKSNAENADAENPHPAGLPMQVYTWRTVFLHSLVGRQQGIGSNLFGLVQEEARLEVAQPSLPPSQVDTALSDLAKRAFYLRHQDGKYFASLEPSVNKALAQIREGVSENRLRDTLDAAARKVVTAPVPTFTVHYDLQSPEDLPDGGGKPMLGIVSLFAEEIKPEEFVHTERKGAPREQQNLVFLLVPNTLRAALSAGGGLYGDDQVRRNLKELQAIACDVVAMRILHKDPQNYSIQAKHLADDNEDGFQARHAEREQALITRVTQSYNALWYPSATGQVVRKEIQSSGGEGGTSVIEQIRQTLIEDQELITEDAISTNLLKQFKPMFFGKETICKIAQIKKNFCDRRAWPILAEPHLLSRMIREGVEKGLWCVYRLGDPSAARPEEFYSRESDTEGVPISVDLNQADYSLVTPEGAVQRGWNANTQVPYETVCNWVKASIDRLDTPTPINELTDQVSQTHGEVSTQDVTKAVQELTRDAQVVTKPKGEKAKHGGNAMLYTPNAEDKVLPVSKAVEQKWIAPPKKFVKIDGFAGRDKVFPCLKRLSSLYTRGATSKIDLLRIERLPLKGSGQVNVTFSGLEPAQIRQMGAMFDAFATLGEPGDDTQVELTILAPEKDCLFLKEITDTKD
jgi:hypothetical protein